VSDFFARPPQPEDPPAEPYVPPPWVEPPRGVLPGVVGMEMVLARNGRAVVFVGGLTVYAEGFEFEVRVLTAGDGWLDPSLNGVYRGRGRGGREDNYDEMLRFGVEFSDGRRASNLGGPGHREGEPQSPVLQGRGGGGNGSGWHQRFWLWPLPPPGPLAFVCEWPAAGIELSRVDIDAGPVIDAAARAQVVFPDQPERDNEVSWSSSSFTYGSASGRTRGPHTPT
jgi:hypothetical protein